MKKAQEKRAKTPKRNLAGKRERKSKDTAKLRQQIETLVKREAVNLVHAAIKESDKGHFAAMKYLFEMIGLYPGPSEAEPQGEDSLARTLLRRLGMPEDPPMGEAAMKPIETATQAGDVLE